MDPRPPDSYGLGYTGQACRDRRHHLCSGWWADAFRPGEGTRCACPCHGDDDDVRAADPPLLTRPHDWPTDK